MILVTGGAGYIGSQIVCELSDAAEELIVLDNLVTGRSELVKGANLIVGDVGDAACLDRLFSEYKISEVIHLAASTVVPESVTNPAKFYLNNTANTALLLKKCVENNVQRFIFSSTAAVYGIPENEGAVTELTSCAPINAYGQSKLMSEQMITDVAKSSGMQYLCLRYFNVAGADPKHRVGPVSPATLLIRVAVQVALGKRNELSIFGDDFPTADGTGVRDYLHVADLAAAHLSGLRYLRSGGESAILNCGYGKGYSVRQVVQAIEQLIGRSLPVVFKPRRPGDPPELIADASELCQRLDWQPQYADLSKIIEDALEWESHLFKQ
jgi:UDP-glucose 4-epimerase